MTREEALPDDEHHSSQYEGFSRSKAAVYSRDGEDVGTVQRVLLGKDGRHYLVVTRSGLLGFATHKVILPLTDFAMRGDQLHIRKMAISDIAKLGTWDENMGAYSAAAPDRPIPVGLWS